MPLRSFDPAEIVLSHRRRLEIPLLLTVWLGTAAFSLADGSGFHVAAATLVVGINLWAAWRQREVYVRRAFVNAGVLAATAVLVMELTVERMQVRGNPPWLLASLGHYLILIQLCKLFERKQARDYVQLLAMSVLLVVAGAMLSTSLWFALAATAHIVLVCHTAMVFTLKRGLDEAAAARLAQEADPVQPHLAAWGVIHDWPGKALRGRLLAVLAVVFLTGLGMFLAAPRPMYAGGGYDHRSRSTQVGFSPNVQLGEQKQIYQSDEPVMTVKVTGSPAGAAAGTRLYLRGMTFDTYRPKGSPSWTNYREPGWRFPPELELDADEPRITQEITCQKPLGVHGLFGLSPIIGADLDAGPAGVDENLGAYGGRDEGHGGPPRRRAQMKYTVRSLAAPLSPAAREVLKPNFPPTADPAASGATPPVADLARQWAGALVEQRDALPPGPRRDQADLGIVQELARRLRQDYPYTLNLEEADPDRDGVEDFLLYMKKGHCEYFASALAVMSRSLGVPARLAVGFLPSEPVREGATITVRACDAHAWVEVYTPSTLWVTFDAVGSERLSAHQTWWASLRRAWSRVKEAWDETVVGYNELARRRLGAALAYAWRSVRLAMGQAVQTLGASIDNLLAEGRIDEGMAWASLVVATLGAVLLAVVIVRMVRREMRYRRLLREGKVVPWPELAFLRRLAGVLERRGARLCPHQTIRENLQAAAAALNLPPEELGALADLYYRLRWGRLRAGPEELRAAEAQVDAIARRLKR